MKFFRFVSYWGGTPLPGLDEEANRARAEKAHRRATVTYNEFFCTDLFHGTAESVAEKLQPAQEEMGLSGFIIDMNCGGLLPLERVLHSMRLFSERVIAGNKQKSVSAAAAL